MTANNMREFERVSAEAGELGGKSRLAAACLIWF